MSFNYSDFNNFDKFQHITFRLQSKQNKNNNFFSWYYWHFCFSRWNERNIHLGPYIQLTLALHSLFRMEKENKNTPNKSDVQNDFFKKKISFKKSDIYYFSSQNRYLFIESDCYITKKYNAMSITWSICDLFWSQNNGCILH